MSSLGSCPPDQLAQNAIHSGRKQLVRSGIVPVLLPHRQDHLVAPVMWLMQREADLEMPVSLGQIIEIDCLNSTVKMLEYSLILLWAQ